MKIKSMTGFGKAECADEKRKIIVEIKTLNSKGADVIIKLPNVFKDKEVDLRNQLIEALQRGKIELYVSIEELEENIPSQFDEAAIVYYYEQLKDIAGRNHITLPETVIETILRLPDVQKPKQDVPDEKNFDLLSRCMAEALEKANHFRMQEGGALAKDIGRRLQLIESYIAELEKYESQRMEFIKARLRQNLMEYVGENTVDQNRFEQELIYYLEKIDINEEKVRLYNHCRFFLATMNEEGGVGKKLGFVAQEMGREINTIGSKANHVEMQQLVVMMKDELEKIKEQISNVL
ncbi:MAG: YicC family protein [Bacteroidales bacterium]|nr:YicC family protein [Bacteroidales bacterium]